MLVLFILFLHIYPILAFHFSLSPSSKAFLLYSNTSPVNATNRILYLQGDCPSSTDQQLSVSTGNRVQSTRLFNAIPNLHCAVTVKLVQDQVRLDRPYVDVLAISDLSILSVLKSSVCVTVQITSPTADTVTSTCQLSPFEEGKHSCLLRVQIPYAWFGTVGRNATRQTLSFSHTVSSTCHVPFYDRPQTPISVLPYIESAQAHTLAKNDEMDLSLLSRANISLSLRSLNSLFVHLSYNSTRETLESLEIRLFLDARLELLSVSSLSSEEWTVRVVSAQRPEVYTAFFCTPKNKSMSYDGYIFSLLLKMRGSIIENRRLERGEEGGEAALHWEIRRRTDSGGGKSGAGNGTVKESIDRVATKFRISPDVVYAVVPIAKTTDIVNTGVLSGRQSSTSMRVYTVTLGGRSHDVTALSHCISQESKVLKTSPTCTTVYVDGTEMRGHSQMKVHVHYEKWTTSIAFTVWYPRLPITLWLKDQVLNSIAQWPVATWKDLKDGRHHKRAAKQFACANRYQQTELTVLASFQVSDERTGERRYLCGSREMMFDVTAMSADSILSADRSIASIRNLNNRILIQAVSPGTTRLVLKRQTPGIDYGSTSITVSEEEVKVTGLSTLPIVEMGLSISPLLGSPSQYSVAVNVETTFTHRYQHGSMFYQLQYSDESSESLDDVIVSDYGIGSISTDERVVALSQKATNTVDMIALDDLSDPSIELELRGATHCRETDSPPLARSDVTLHIQFADDDSTRLAVARAISGNGSAPSSSLPPTMTSSPWRMDTLMWALLLVIALVGLVRLISGRSTSFSGRCSYEKLVAPILSRLSSSSSGGGGRDEDTKEWVWMSRNDSNSIGSRYSQKSTINVPDQSSPSYDDNTHTSISYRGSEISVFISPTPVITVHADRGSGGGGGGGSWRSNGRSRRAARHALVDSSSDHNLARVVQRSGSWRDEPSAAWPHHTWNAKRRPGPPAVKNYDGMRESVA